MFIVQFYIRQAWLFMKSTNLIETFSTSALHILASFDIWTIFYISPYKIQFWEHKMWKILFSHWTHFGLTKLYEWLFWRLDATSEWSCVEELKWEKELESKSGKCREIPKQLLLSTQDEISSQFCICLLSLCLSICGYYKQYLMWTCLVFIFLTLSLRAGSWHWEREPTLNKMNLSFQGQ